MAFVFFNDTATTEIYTLSLHDALPIYDISILAKEFKEKESEIIGFYNKIEQVKAEALEKIEKADQLVVSVIADMEDKIIDRMEAYIVDNLFSLLIRAIKRFIGRKNVST